MSKLNASADATTGSVIKEMGIVGLFTRGLPLRIVMIGTLTGLQWSIYDAFKLAARQPEEGERSCKKESSLCSGSMGSLQMPEIAVNEDGWGPCTVPDHLRYAPNRPLPPPPPPPASPPPAPAPRAAARRPGVPSASGARGAGARGAGARGAVPGRLPRAARCPDLLPPPPPARPAPPASHGSAPPPPPGAKKLELRSWKEEEGKGRRLTARLPASQPPAPPPLPPPTPPALPFPAR